VENRESLSSGPASVSATVSIECSGRNTASCWSTKKPVRTSAGRFRPSAAAATGQRSASSASVKNTSTGPSR
jgi:hypothetical protein